MTVAERPQKGMDAMNPVQRYLTQIRTQLVALTVSQKLVIALLAVIMLATILWGVVFSAKPQLVPLTAEPMTPEEINRVEMALKGKHNYQVSGDKVLVPVDEQYSIRGSLWAQQAMPRKASAFTDLIAKQNPFTPEAQNNRAWVNALQVELTRTLQNFPYVDDASVIVAMGAQAGLGRAAMRSTASVFVKTHGNEDISSQQVLAIVDMVTGTVSGMKRENVNLVVNGQRTHRAPSSDTPMPSNLVEYKKTLEDYFASKLYGHLSSYGDVKIAVNVVPDLSVRHMNDIIVDPKNKLVLPESTIVKESTQHDGAGPGGEPGVKSNDALATDTVGPARGGSSITTEENTRNRVIAGEMRKETLLPAGVEYKELTASLLFPRSYFVSYYRRQSGDAKAEPDDKTLQPVIDQQLKSAVANAKNAIGAKADDQIRADWYDDLIVAHVPELVLARGGVGPSGGVMPMVGTYAKQGILAIVALGVLGMMLMMVKRAVPAGASEMSDDSSGLGSLGGLGGLVGGKKRKGSSVEQLDAADDVFGEANQGEAVLTGIELDDETLASRKMVDEVSVMIKENPENAAALV